MQVQTFMGKAHLMLSGSYFKVEGSPIYLGPH